MVDARALTVGLVVVAVVALGMTAAGVDSVDPDTDSEEREPPGTAPPTPTPSSEDGSDSGFETWCPGPLSDLPVLLAAFLSLAAAGALGYRRTGTVLVPALVVAPTALYLLVSCGGELPSVGPAFDGIGSLLGAVFGAPVLLAGGLLLALAGAVALLYVTGEMGTFADAEAWTADADDRGDLEAVGEAAGAAADRIEGQADASNEVYRAWVEMTRHLDVAHPETTAPDEFADAAVAAGMAEDDVATLTRLFQDVRYGGADPDARTEAAVDALRGIERTYGGSGS